MNRSSVVRNLKKSEAMNRKASEKVSMTVKNDTGFKSFISKMLKMSILIFFGVVVLFPFYYMISISFLADENALNGPYPLIPEGMNWDTYKYVVATEFLASFTFSIIVMIVNVMLRVIVCMLLGYAFGMYNFSGKKIMWHLLMLTMVIPEVALISAQYRITINLGLDSGIGVLLGLAAPFVATMFMAYMFRNAFETIPNEVKEAAMIDGIGGVQFFFKIAVPMISSTIWTVVILTAFASWNSYVWPSLLLSDSNLNTMTLWIFNVSIDPEDNLVFKNLEMAAATITVIPTIVVYLIFKNKINSTVAASGGVKG